MAQFIVTHIESFNSFLQFFGHFDTILKQNTIIQKHINSLLIHGPVEIPKNNQIPIGMMCVTKRRNEYCRATIVAVRGLNQVFIKYIDYGDFDTVQLHEVRIVSDSSLFTNIVPQAFSFILSGIFCDWKQHEIDEVYNDLLHQQVEIHKEMEFCDFVFVRIICRYGDYTKHLLETKHIGYPIKLEDIAQTFKEILAKLNNGAMTIYQPAMAPFPSISGPRFPAPTFLPHATLPTSQLYHNWNNIWNPGANNQRPSAPQKIRGNLKGVGFQSHKEHKFTCTSKDSVKLKETENRKFENSFAVSNEPSAPFSDLPPKGSVRTFKSNTLMIGLEKDDNYTGISGDDDEYEEREPYQHFKGKAEIPPRFQKQQTENKHYSESKSSYPKQRTSSISELSSKHSKSFTKQSSQISSINEDMNLDSTSIADIDWGTNTTHQTKKVEIIEFSPFASDLFKKDYLNYLPVFENIIISWWISPHQFYINNKKHVKQLEKMMKEIQAFYKMYSINSLKFNELSINTHCIVHNRLDSLFYRAKILAVNSEKKKYKVELLDVGNQLIVEEKSILSVEKRFTKLPIMAHQCSLNGIVSNYSDHEKSLSYINKYLKPDDVLSCEYVRKDSKNDIYYVEIRLNDGTNLKDLLIQDGIISSVDDDLNVKLLSGQQIKAKISLINDLLDFQIETDGCDEFKLLCSYNDIKFVKSNPNLSFDFKNIYEGTVCVIDILDVTRDKVLMVQPLIPLFNISIPKVICDYPIMHQAFSVKIAHIETPNMIYVHSTTARDLLYQLLDKMYEYYETKGEVLKEKTIGTLCAVKSSDENWYRARIISNKNNELIIVHYLDYGNNEEITTDIEDRFKELENQFFEISALAIRCFLPIKCPMQQQSIEAPPIISTIINEMKSLTMTDSHKIELILNIIERYNASWIVDIYLNRNEDNNNGSNRNGDNGQSLISVLKEKLLIQGMDIGFVKNLLDTITEHLIHNGIKRDLYYDGVDVNNHICQQQQNEQSVLEEIELLCDKRPPSITMEKEIDADIEECTSESEKKEEDNQSVNVIEQKIATITTEQEQNQNGNVISINFSLSVICYIVSPKKFYIQKNFNLIVKDIFKKLNIGKITLSKYINPLPNDTCIAVYNRDFLKYRAKLIKKVACDKWKVQFIDYGNISITNHIFEMPDEFKNIPPQCYRCELYNPNNIDFEKGIVIKRFHKICGPCLSKTIRIKPIEQTSKSCVIEMNIGGINIYEVFKQKFIKIMHEDQSDENCDSAEEEFQIDDIQENVYYKIINEIKEDLVKMIDGEIERETFDSIKDIIQINLVTFLKQSSLLKNEHKELLKNTAESISNTIIEKAIIKHDEENRIKLIEMVGGILMAYFEKCFAKYDDESDNLDENQQDKDIEKIDNEKSLNNEENIDGIGSFEKGGRKETDCEKSKELEEKNTKSNIPQGGGRGKLFKKMFQENLFKNTK